MRNATHDGRSSLSESQNMERQPVSFFLKGLGALAVLLILSVTMEPSPQVYALRALIGVGIGLVCLKIVLRRFNIDFPPRHRRPGLRRPIEDDTDSPRR